MKFQLTNSDLLFEVDSCDVEFVESFRWRLVNGYVQRSSDRKYLHRLLVKPENGLQVDHIDRDKLNNRRANLRVVTNSENCQNQGSRGGSSKYRGVCYHKHSGKWVADVVLNGKHNYLGLFELEEDAAKAASEFRRKNMIFSREEE